MSVLSLLLGEKVLSESETDEGLFPIIFTLFSPHLSLRDIFPTEGKTLKPQIFYAKYKFIVALNPSVKPAVCHLPFQGRLISGNLYLILKL